MLSASQQKLLTALQVKKYRQKYRKFTVEGTKMATELLGQFRIPVVAIYGLERWALENVSLLAPFNHIFNLVTETELKKISTLSTPNEVLAVAEIPPPPPRDLERGAFYLDGIRDPGNLGTIWRIADWFNFQAIFCSTDCADLYSPKVIQASMGAVFRVPALEIDLDELLGSNPGWPVLGATMTGESLFDAILPDHGLLVIGNEGSGIRPGVEACLTRRLTIPRSPESGAESLNASVAAGILAAFFARPELAVIKK